MKPELIIYRTVITALLIIIFWQQCNIPDCHPEPGEGQTHDTIRIILKDTTKSTPQPIAIIKPLVTLSLSKGNHLQPYTPTNTTTPQDYEPATTCHPELVEGQQPEEPCSYQVIYSDTITKPFGSIIIDDTVSGNRLTGRTVTTSITSEKITITKVKEVPQRRTQLYAGINIYGNQAEPLYGLGPSIILKTKKDKAISAGAIYTASGWVYTAGYHFKLSFRKQ